MIGIILAGGTGSRLLPLTKSINKHLVNVAGVPMIYHPLALLRRSGIKDIIVVTGVDHMGQIVDQLGSGSDFDLNITYKVQDTAGGIAQALGICAPIVRDQNCMVVLGDNIFPYLDCVDEIADFERSTTGTLSEYPKAHLFLKEVSDPHRFGVAHVDHHKSSIVHIVEKPKHSESNLAVTGLYMYDSNVFEVIKTLVPSNRGELEITDVNNWYVKNGEVKYTLYDEYWSDSGTHISLKNVNDFLVSYDWEYWKDRHERMEKCR